ncbi:MAG: zinc-binding dehydrogenase [Bacteroidetes bacterium]|nr:zinc-binding dehydrogenase [Bacteroidota bacterium]
MKAIVLKEYNNNLSRVLRSLEVINKDIRPLKDDEVLVKISAAPCNPSDIAFVRGMYNIRKPLPVVSGFEGAGSVVAAGKSSEARNLLGKRVCCFTQDDGDGTWAEYFITKPDKCIAVHDDLDILQAACLAINPFTAYALVDTAVRYGSEAVINTAAAGQIGRFVRALARDKNITLINIVRQDNHLEMLKNEGENYVLNIRSEQFEDQLKELAHELKATTAFDALGGESTARILQAMPNASQLILYGGLANQYIANIDVLEIIFKKKSIVGFNLGDWKKEIGPETFSQISSDIQNMIIKGMITTKIQHTYKLEEVIRALLQYVGHMSDGKILFTP